MPDAITRSSSYSNSKLWRALLAIMLAAVMAAGFAAKASAAIKFSAIAVDARTGAVLFSTDPDGLRYPASLTKVMTLYILFQELKAGKKTLDSPITVSKRAAGMAPSKLGVKPGQTIRVEDAIKSLVTLSANDIATAIGEDIGGNEGAFAERMTRTARSLGMSRTVFKNASGLPNPGQVTTARDIATLSLRIQRDFPQYYPYFKLMSFNYKGRVIRTHNRLLGRFEGTDGIKTGYIRASGFNLTSSVKRGDKRIIGVVMGGKTGSSRNSYMISMLSKYLPKCKDGKALAASIGGAAAPTIVEEPTQVASAEGEAPTKPAKPSRMGSKPSDKTMEDLAAEATTDQGDVDENAAEDGETLVAEIPPENNAASSEQPMVIDGTVQPKALAALSTQSPTETSVGKQPAGQLPFAVKNENDNSGWQGQVLVTPSESSWKIQIGAFPDKHSAQEKLRIARKSGIALLTDKQAFTIQVQKGSEVIYRARFSGFSEDGARAACRQLTQKGIGCVALSPQS